MAIQVVGHEVLTVTAELALAHFLVQRGKEEVLKNRLVVVAFLCVEGGQQLGGLVRVESGRRDLLDIVPGC